MNNITTKEEALKLIDKLADNHGKADQIMGVLRQYLMLEDWLAQLDAQMEFAFWEALNIATAHQIHLHDILDKMKITLKDRNGESWAMNPAASKLIALWEACGDYDEKKKIKTGGIKKPLSEIAEFIACDRCGLDGDDVVSCQNMQKKYEAQKLFTFINSLGL